MVSSENISDRAREIGSWLVSRLYGNVLTQDALDELLVRISKALHEEREAERLTHTAHMRLSDDGCPHHSPELAG